MFRLTEDDIGRLVLVLKDGLGAQAGDLLHLIGATEENDLVTVWSDRLHREMDISRKHVSRIPGKSGKIWKLSLKLVRIWHWDPMSLFRKKRS